MKDRDGNEIKAGDVVSVEMTVIETLGGVAGLGFNGYETALFQALPHRIKLVSSTTPDFTVKPEFLPR